MITYLTLLDGLTLEEQTDGSYKIKEGATYQPEYYILLIVYSVATVIVDYILSSLVDKWTNEENNKY